MSRDLALAWHVAAFQRQQRLPSLRDLLRQVAAKSGLKQSVGEMRSALRVIAEQFGSRLQTVNLAEERARRDKGRRGK